MVGGCKPSGGRSTYIVPKLFHIISFIYNGLSNIFYLNYTFIPIAKHSYPADILYCSIF